MNLTGLFLCAATLTPGQMQGRLEINCREGLENQPVLSLFGPEVESMAKVDAQGLRFSMPAGRRDTNSVGAEAQVRLRGDFEITLDYDLVAVPEPGPLL